MVRFTVPCANKARAACDHRGIEVWLHTFAVPRQTAEVARHAEAWGFSGLLVADSQNLAADVLPVLLAG